MGRKEIIIKRPTEYGVVTSKIERYGSLNWWTDVSVTAVRSDNWTPNALPDYQPDTYHGNRLSAFIFRKYHEYFAKKALKPARRRVASVTR